MLPRTSRQEARALRVSHGEVVATAADVGELLGLAGDRPRDGGRIGQGQLRTLQGAHNGRVPGRIAVAIH